MTATNDPLARVQAMVSAWDETELFDTFDTGASEVSPPNPLDNCGFGHSRHFRHQRSEQITRRQQSAHAYPQDALQQASASRVVSYSIGVESVESVENVRTDREHSDLVFDTSSSQVSKNRGRVSKTGRSAASKAPLAGMPAPVGVPAEWIQGVARLPELPCPARFPAAKWRQVVMDAAAFLERWAAQAAALGWPAWELFGCHCRAPWGRIQGMGLVLLLQGDEIAALTAVEAVIRTPTGAHQRYRRKPADPLHPAERCLVWDLDTTMRTLHEAPTPRPQHPLMVENRMKAERLPERATGVLVDQNPSLSWAEPELVRQLSAKRSVAGRRPMSRRIKPHKVRGRELEEVREKDPEGRIVVHHRTVDTLNKMLRAGTISQEMHDAAKDFQAAFIIANLDPLRALPMLRVPGTGRDPDLNDRQLYARRRVHKALEALGGISSPAGSCVWHVVGLQRSVREWAMRQGWGGRPVRQEQAQGILVAALGMLAAHVGYGEAKPAS
jgi:hypothetical protein